MHDPTDTAPTPQSPMPPAWGEYDQYLVSIRPVPGGYVARVARPHGGPTLATARGESAMVAGTLALREGIFLGASPPAAPAPRHVADELDRTLGPTPAAVVDPGGSS